MSRISSNRMVGFGVGAFAIAAFTLSVNVPARASLTLTAAGAADGFVLSNYASGGAFGTYPFLAAAQLSDGTLAVVNNGVGLNKYADVDGQTPGSSLGFQSLGGVINIANVGGKAYASVLGGGLYSVSSSLGLTPVSVPGYTFGYGLWGNLVSGHLLSAGPGNSGIYEVNPLTGTFRNVESGIAIDGVSVSPDGTIAYGAAYQLGKVIGWNIATGMQVFSYTPPGGTGPDGSGVISGGKYSGYVVSNNNNGTVTLIDPTGATATVIAAGGSRGDFATPDLNNGTLLLAEYGESWRLKAPGGSFVVPEPSSLSICGILAACMLSYRWTRKGA
jgi:hypothetical protein